MSSTISFSNIQTLGKPGVSYNTDNTEQHLYNQIYK